MSEQRTNWLVTSLLALTLALALLYANAQGHNRELREQIKTERARVDRLIVKGVWTLEMEPSTRPK